MGFQYFSILLLNPKTFLSYYPPEKLFSQEDKIDRQALLELAKGKRAGKMGLEACVRSLFTEISGVEADDAEFGLLWVDIIKESFPSLGK